MKHHEMDQKRPIILTGDQTAIIFDGIGHVAITNRVRKPADTDKGTEIPDTNKMISFCTWALRQGILKTLFMNEITRIKNKALKEELQDEEVELLSLLLGQEVTEERLAEARKKFKEGQQSDD